MVKIKTITDESTPEDTLFKEKWVRKLMVCTLHDLGIACPGICSHPIPNYIKGRHCSAMSRALNKGTKSIYRKLRELLL